MPELEITLDAAEARVLGALLEKQVLTPDAYPLTLNYLTNACNQKTSREPVTNLGDAEVAQAIVGLRRKGLAIEMKTAEGRVLKYSHNLPKLAALSAKEQAALCLLLLRGPQTSGEIKGRSERLAEFASIEDVESTLAALTQKSCGSLAARLPRRPGTKEQRWVQLLTGQPAEGAEAPVPRPVSDVAALETRVAALEAEVGVLKQALLDLSHKPQP